MVGIFLLPTFLTKLAVILVNTAKHTSCLMKQISIMKMQ